MAENTKVEWAKHSFNSWWGCTKTSPACDFCYAERDAKRFAPDKVYWGVNAERREFGDKHWNEPLRWAKKYQQELADWVKMANAAGGQDEAIKRGILPPERPRVFCASMADVFDKNAPEGARDRLWKLIKDTESSLDWLIVTKRIGNAKDMLPADWGDGYPNVWLIITVCNQEEADRDIPKLLDTPAVIRGLSMEPLLGPVNLNINLPAERMLRWHRPMLSMLDWIIVGGESGPHARPMHPDWVRSLRDQARTAMVPFFYKQWGEWVPAMSLDDLRNIGDEMRAGKAVHLYGSGREPDGHFRKGDVHMRKVGKAAAGRLLDGIEYSEFPVSRLDNKLHIA